MEHTGDTDIDSHVVWLMVMHTAADSSADNLICASHIARPVIEKGQLHISIPRLPYVGAHELETPSEP